MGTDRVSPAAGQGFSPAALLLQRKSIPAINVIVGVEPAQIRFLEQHLNTTARRVDRVNDDMIAGSPAALFQVYAPHSIDLSPEMRNRVAFWSADPIGRGSATIKAIVKCALTLVEFPKPPTKEAIQIVEGILDRDKVEDIRGLLWKAASLLLSNPKPPTRWLNPWESPDTWFNNMENPEQRLRTLYNLLVNYCFYLEHGDEGLKGMKVKPSEIQKIRNLTLDPTKVYKTICLLSPWNQGRLDTYICAIRISVTWDAQ